MQRIEKEKIMYQSVGKNKTTMLNAERVRQGLSQEELACLAGVEASDISGAESLGMRLCPEQARRIGEVLGVEPEQLQELVELEPRTNPQKAEETSSTNESNCGQTEKYALYYARTIRIC